jgi:hypothetical protein
MGTARALPLLREPVVSNGVTGDNFGDLAFQYDLFGRILTDGISC